MKICENCGMEYGDDNAFCPFCDERYGVVILADDVISAVGLPAYKEEFPAIGETGVKYESFAANRDKIFKRNIRLAKKEDAVKKKDVHILYKPVDPLVKFDKDGEIIPYAPINPVVKSYPKHVKRKLPVGRILCISAGLAVLIFIGKNLSDGLNDTDYYIDPPLQEVSEAAYDEAAYEIEPPSINERPKYVLASSSNAGRSVQVYGSDEESFMYIMHKPDNGYWDYQFKYYDKGNAGANFPKLFADCEEFKECGFTEMLIEYPHSDATSVLLINDGVPDMDTEKLYISSTENYKGDASGYREIGYNDIVLGHFTTQTPIDPSEFEFNDRKLLSSETYIPPKITVKSESGLQMKLTYDSELEKNFVNYKFKFTNTSNSDIDSFCNEFTGAEYADKFYYLMAIDYETNETLFAEYWSDGIPQLNRVYTVKPEETVRGEIWLDFRDKD